MEGFLTTLARLTHAHAGKVVLAFLASVIPALYLIGQLEFREDFGDLLPKGTQAVIDLNTVAEKTGGTAFIVVAVDARDEPRAKRFARDLEHELGSLDSVLYVEGHVDTEFIRERQLLYLSVEDLEEVVDRTTEQIDKRYVAESGLFVDLEEPTDAAPAELDLEDLRKKLDGHELPVRDYLIGKDGRYLYVFIRLKGQTGDLAFGAAALDDVKGIVAGMCDGTAYPDDLEVRYTGSIVIRLEENEILENDLARAGLLGFLAVVLLITLYTRYLRALILVSLPLIVGAAWTFAFASVAIGHLNIITGFLGAILFGLGIDFSVHMFLRYVEERRQGHDTLAATTRALTLTGRAVVGGAVTTAAAFFMVRFADFKGYNEFGLLASVGILVMLVVSLTLFPALNVLLERARALKPRPVSASFERGISVPPVLRWVIVIGVPLFAIFSVHQMLTGQVGFKTNWRELKGESPASDFDDYMIESLGSSFSLTLVLVNDEAQTATVAAAVERVRQARTAAGLESGVTHTLSIRDLVPPGQDERKEQIEELARQLGRVPADTLTDTERPLLDQAKRLARAEPFEKSEVPRSLVQRFETHDKEGTMMVLVTRYLFYELDEIMAWSDEMEALRRDLNERGVEAHVMSENWIVGSVFRIMLGDGPYIVWSAFLAIFLVLLIDFRSLRTSLIVLTPLALGMLSIGGAMALFGMKLNFFNGVVIPSTVGIGIDNAIHIYHRYQEEGPGSAPRVLRHSASATWLASFTTLMGFGAMIVAHHKGIRSVAELAVLSITLTYLCTSVFFPLALETFEGKTRKRA